MKLTIRRWKHFGLSGAKLIWGGEAVASTKDVPIPNQLVLEEGHRAIDADLRETLVAEHTNRFGGQAADTCTWFAIDAFGPLRAAACQANRRR